MARRLVLDLEPALRAALAAHAQRLGVTEAVAAAGLIDAALGSLAARRAGAAATNGGMTAEQRKQRALKAVAAREARRAARRA